MQPASLDQIRQQYQQLRAQLARNQISQGQFEASVQQLRLQDAGGIWWTIDPASGNFLKYINNQWVAVQAQPPPAPGPARPPSPARAPSPQPEWAGAAPQKEGARLGCLVSPRMVGFGSFGAAILWFLYTSLSPSSEGKDWLTPLTIGAVPYLLRSQSARVDKLLAPLTALTARFPRPLRVGAAFALPVVMALMFTGPTNSGYGALRTSVIISTVGSYILTRVPEVLS